jgi:hypothetical protein
MIQLRAYACRRPLRQWGSCYVSSTLRLALGARCMSSSSEASPQAAPMKPKPKSTTPLRRSASASLPIRSSPTRGDIQPVFTLATAERYRLSSLRARLPPHSQTFHESWWVPHWEGGEIFVFANGSFVCWGLGEQGARRFAKEVIGRAVSPPAEIAPLKDPETEELEFVVDPTELGGAYNWQGRNLTQNLVSFVVLQKYSVARGLDHPWSDISTCLRDGGAFFYS